MTDEPDPVIGRLARETSDWEAVVRLAARNKVAPLLYRALQAHDAEVEPDVSRALGRYSEEVLRRNTALANSLLDIALLFDRNRILAAPYRGPALSLILYNSLGLRQISDLDFIVPAEAFNRASEVLTDNGFICLSARRGDWTRTIYEADRESPVVIDLHSRIASRALPAFGFSLETISTNTRRVRFLEGEIATFTSSYTLLIMSAVITKEWLYRRPILAYASDLCRLMRMLSAQEVSDALAGARSLGVAAAMDFAISTSSTLVGLSSPRAGGVPMPRQAREATRVWAELSYTNGIRMVLFLRASDLGLYDRPVRASIRYFVELAASLPYRLLVPTPADRAWVPVHASLRFLYPLIRIARLVTTFALLPLARRIGRRLS